MTLKMELLGGFNPMYCTEEGAKTLVVSEICNRNSGLDARLQKLTNVLNLQK